MNSNVARRCVVSCTTRLLLFTLFALSSFTRLSAQSIVQPVGVGKAFSNLQDSIALNYYLPPQGVIGGADGFSLGMVRTTAQAPNVPGMSQADGRALSIGSNSSLFSLTGFSYGGDNQSTFNIPNVAGRAIVGAGTAAGQPTHWTPGLKQGSATVTLKEDNLPMHVHPLPGAQFTTPSGKNVPYNNVQPSIALNYLVRTDGLFPSDRDGLGLGEAVPYLGTVVPWTGSLNNVPAGWTPADGRIINIAGPLANQALFAIIGTRFGGNGTTNFALPDLRGRTIVGAGERLGGVGSPVGEAFGAETHTLVQSEMPFHSHPIKPTGTSGPAGGNQPVDNRQPSLALTYAIAVGAQFPPPNTAGENIYIGEVVAYAGDFVPPGFLLADGRTLSKDQYSALFALLGTTYGGDGVTNFKLPDLRARTVIGAGPGAPVGMETAAASQLPPGTAAGTISEDEDIVYMVGELAGASDFLLDEENLGEHGFEVIPEPATLLLVGLAALSGMTLRRNRRTVSMANYAN